MADGTVITLEQAVKEIVSKYNKGDRFESHDVITILKNDYTQIYAGSKTINQNDAQYHGHISHIIRNSGLVRNVDEIDSQNVHGNLSSNKLWQKL